MNTISEQLHRLLAGIVKDPEFFANLNDETDLVTQGNVDSIAMVEFVDMIEKHFAVEFDVSHLTSENFRSIGAICKLLMNFRIAI